MFDPDAFSPEAFSRMSFLMANESPVDERVARGGGWLAVGQAVERPRTRRQREDESLLMLL